MVSINLTAQMGVFFMIVPRDIMICGRVDALIIASNKTINEMRKFSIKKKFLILEWKLHAFCFQTLDFGWTNFNLMDSDLTVLLRCSINRMELVN